MERAKAGQGLRPGNRYAAPDAHREAEPNRKHAQIENAKQRNCDAATAPRQPARPRGPGMRGHNATRRDTCRLGKDRCPLRNAGREEKLRRLDPCAEQQPDRY